MISNFFKFKKWIIRSAVLIIGILTLLILAFFIFRNAILRSKLEDKLTKFNTRYSASLFIGNASMTGISGVKFSSISLTGSTTDTLLTVDSAYFQINFWKLLFGTIKINEIKIISPSVFIVKKDSIDNFSFLFKHEASNFIVVDSAFKKVNYRDRSVIVFNTIFERIPDNVLVKNISVSYCDSAHEVKAVMPELCFNSKIFSGYINFTEDTTKTNLHITGRINDDDHEVEASLINPIGTEQSLPFTVYAVGAFVGIDTLTFRFRQSETNKGVRIEGYGLSGKLLINHERISKQSIVFEKLAFNYNLTIGEHFFEFDSTSAVTINSFTFHPFLRFDLNQGKQITLIIHEKDFPSENLFSSLPEGLFSTLHGIKTKGTMSYSLDFKVDLNNPDSLLFASNLEAKDFSIIKYGKVNYSMMNDTFLHTVFEDGKPVRDILVGPPNPDFTPIENISPFLRNAVLCSEDGIFYYHQGFIADAFRQSIVTNIKERRFARGGSTITMQLVKNVFLNRNKTIARKLEEVIIVWLIENQRLCSKERMYEVYLNVIEWGPNIYGITEASRFYFKKKPCELTLNESLFLACIVPRPKSFKYFFNDNHTIRDFVVAFQQNVTAKMLEKQWISLSDMENFVPGVKLTGSAEAFLHANDSSLTSDPLEEIILRH